MLPEHLKLDDTYVYRSDFKNDCNNRFNNKPSCNTSGNLKKYINSKRSITVDMKAFNDFEKFYNIENFGSTMLQ